MSVIVAKGEEARNLNSNNGGNYEWLRLKDGEKRRVMFLTPASEFASYYAHGDYQRKINTHACLKAGGGDCPSCRHDVPKKLQTIVLFWDIDNEKVLIFDTGKKHMNTVYGTVDEYEDDYMNMAFTLKRTGERTNTTYSMQPILKLKKEDQEKADNRKNAELPDNLEKLIMVKKPEELEEMYANMDDLPETPESEF